MASNSESNGASSKQVHTLPLVKAGPLHGPETAPAHGHGQGGKDHVPHVLPMRVYLGTWIALLVLTVITVGASYIDIGSFNILLALLIATMKASIVAAIFMHLRWDHKFHTIVFSFSIVFLAIFIAFTMYDTETRGRTDAPQADRPVEVTNPFKGGQAEERLKRLHPNDVPPPAEPPR
jgi:cytochrome c oxidase subunit IV